MKINKFHIIEFLEGKKNHKGTESIFKTIIAEKFLNLGEEMNIHSHEAQNTTNKATPRSIIIKLSKIKEKERILRLAKTNREVR